MFVYMLQESIARKNLNISTITRKSDVANRTKYVNKKVPPYVNFQQKGCARRCVWNKAFLLGQPYLFTLQFIMLL